MRYVYTLLFMLCGTVAALAQDSLQFRLRQDIPVAGAAGALAEPWSGGLNAPQFSTIDLDKDGQQDLLVFDRVQQKVFTWLAVQENGSWRYSYAPAYETFFPGDLTDWVLLRDYNCDGLKDIFTSSPLGMRVFKQEKAPRGQLKFSLEEDGVFYNNNVNLQMNSADIPAISDMDGDGDLDILVTEFSLGYTLEYYRNMQVEQGLPCGAMQLVRDSRQWGNITECEGCNAYTFNAQCRVLAPAHNGHNGSALLLLDLDADNDQDLLISAVQCKDLVMMPNKGNKTEAAMTSYTTGFPGTKPASFGVFPAAFYEDVTFDGVPDLLVAPQATYQLKNINLQQSSWLYKNAGAANKPDFNFLQDDFLQSQMIDLSEGAYPAFSDIDEDGDQDMLIGNHASLRNGQYSASISYFKNTGTAATPAFALETNDYLQLAGSGLLDIYPAFADLNGDGAADLVLTYRAPEGNTNVHYIPNKAPKGKAAIYTFSDIRTLMAVGSGDMPAFFDADADGDLDLVLGEVSGRLQFYRNTGSLQQPAYTLTTNALGGLDDNYTRRNLRPAVADVDGDGSLDLLTVDDSGELRVYRHFTASLDTTFTPDTKLLENTLTAQLQTTRFGRGLSVAAAPLGGAGKLFLTIGTQGGGLYLLEQTAGNATNPTEAQDALLLQLYPNPADRAGQPVAHARASEPVAIAVYDVVGRQVYQRAAFRRTHDIPLQQLQAGIYIVRGTTATGQQVTAKLLVR